MTARQLLDFLSQHPAIVGGLVLLPPVLAFLVPFLHGAGKGREAPWKYVYSFLVYAAAVPGMGATVVTAYRMFFTRESLLDADLLVSFGPILSMVLTLILIARVVSFDALPGFDRLAGLMTLIGVTFGILLAIHKTFIGILFGGSIFLLVGIGAFLFALLKWGSALLFRKSSDPRPERPRFS
ncbi:MAG: hypothetical protein JNK60_06795 [Acidobacteria bacterium]|nr:hypothetical protein [Acidobacteriota bacterium]